MTLPPTVNLTFDVDFFYKKWDKSSQKKGLASILTFICMILLSCDDKKTGSYFQNDAAANCAYATNLTFDMDFFH